MSFPEQKPLPADFTLGDWIVRPSRNRLARTGCPDDSRVVGPKVMTLLLVLVETAGQVVSKERLVEQVWDGDFVTDEVVTTLVYALRRALGDDARRPRFVETIRGRGYRLIGSVGARTTPRAEAPAMIAGAPAAAPALDLRRPRRRWLEVAAVALLVFGWSWWRHASPSASVPASRGSAPAMASGERTLPPAAAEAYALGRHFLDRGGLEDLAKARRHLLAVARAAPEFAPARSALADAWIESVSFLPQRAQAEALGRAQQAAQAALRVDAKLPAAHRALGWLALQRDWDGAGAEAHFARVGPDEPGGERHLARFLSARGEHAAAVKVGGREVLASPTSTAARLAMAEVFYHARRYDDALYELDHAEELEGPSVESSRLRADVLGGLGFHSEALRACIRDIELSKQAPIDQAALGSAFAEGGLLGARRLLFQQLAKVSTPAPDSLRMARLGAAAHDTAATLDWLDRAVAERHAGVIWLGADPIYDSVRQEPRFFDLLARIGFGG